MTISMTRPLTAAALAVALLASTLTMLTVGPAGAQDATLCVTDAEGDTAGTHLPDLLEACIVVVGQSIQFTATLDRDFDSSDDLDFRIDVDGDLIEDLRGTRSAGNTFVVVNADDDVVCESEWTSIDGQFQTTGMAASCLGVTQVRFYALSEAQSGSDDVDRAPEAGFTDFLQLDGTGTPPPAQPSGEVGRIAGPSRIDTSVEISQFQFPAGSRDVYLSRADEFADSISSGSLTSGPVLLVPQCGAVPGVVLDEVARLAPDNVYALGGTAAVCDQVLTDVAAAAGL